MAAYERFYMVHVVICIRSSARGEAFGNHITGGNGVVADLSICIDSKQYSVGMSLKLAGQK